MAGPISKVAVLYGGSSLERSVSLVSGHEVARALSKQGYEVFKIDTKGNFLEQLINFSPDVAFNALHGKWGEDGIIQGVLEVLRIPYTHSGVLASSIAMNKHLAKTVFKGSGLPVADHLVLKKGFIFEDIPFTYPYVLKPVSGGSSLDVYILKNQNDWSRIKIDKNEMPTEFLIEPFIPGRELTVTVMGDRALSVTDIVSDTWYDYDAKYELGGSRHILPAEIPNEITQLCLSHALKSHTSLGCRGVSRIDFRWNEMLGAKGLFVLELNTQPGMTPTSLVPEQAKYCGTSFENLCKWLIEDASCDR
ncbi:MAG: D-alanine--D-alanine ligase [Paracoccaceae bacterium]|nr:D-alanine--D-alanine ligase [Paracoccaceae bacterium]